MKEPAAIEQFRRDLPPALASVIRQMMAKRAEDRFQTPAEVTAALRTAQQPGNRYPLSVQAGHALVAVVVPGGPGPIPAVHLPAAQPLGNPIRPIQPLRVQVLTRTDGWWFRREGGWRGIRIQQGCRGDGGFGSPLRSSWLRRRWA